MVYIHTMCITTEKCALFSIVKPKNISKNNDYRIFIVSKNHPKVYIEVFISIAVFNEHFFHFTSLVSLQ